MEEKSEGKCITFIEEIEEMRMKEKRWEEIRAEKIRRNYKKRWEGKKGYEKSRE